MIELNFRATPLLKSHKQLNCTNYAQISEIWCKINYSVKRVLMPCKGAIHKGYTIIGQVGIWIQKSIKYHLPPYEIPQLSQRY